MAKPVDISALLKDLGKARDRASHPQVELFERTILAIAQMAKGWSETEKLNADLSTMLMAAKLLAEDDA